MEREKKGKVLKYEEKNLSSKFVCFQRIETLLHSYENPLMQRMLNNIYQFQTNNPLSQERCGQMTRKVIANLYTTAHRSRIYYLCVTINYK